MSRYQDSIACSLGSRFPPSRRIVRLPPDVQSRHSVAVALVAAGEHQVVLRVVAFEPRPEEVPHVDVRDLGALCEQTVHGVGHVAGRTETAAARAPAPASGTSARGCGRAPRARPGSRAGNSRSACPRPVPRCRRRGSCPSGSPRRRTPTTGLPGSSARSVPSVTGTARSRARSASARVQGIDHGAEPTRPSGSEPKTDAGRRGVPDDGRGLQTRVRPGPVGLVDEPMPSFRSSCHVLKPLRSRV